MGLIRPVERADAPALLELRLANRDYFQRWEPDFDDPDRWYTLESVVAWITDEQHRFVILDDGAIAGMVAVTGVARGAFESAMISYFVAAARSGRGLASAAVADAMGFAFGELGLHRARGGDRDGEHRLATSARAQRLHEGRARCAGICALQGVWVDHLLWERLADD